MDNIETQPIEESQAWVKLHAPLPFLYLQCQDPQEEVNMITVGPMAYRDDDAFSDCSTGRSTMKRGKKIPKGTFQDTSSAFFSC